MNRRQFLKGGLSVAGTALVVEAARPGTAQAKASGGAAKAAIEQVGTFIDLTRCDGCPGQKTPACVEACRVSNAERFPEPRPEDLKPYWPQKKFEDWSDKRHLTGRLTPYNWTTVQRVEVEHQGRRVTLNVPRRCMHCDNPPCAKLCPFGAQSKTALGPVVIDEELCFGGAKCRSVCPWGIPARQAGVGLYLEVAPKFAGGGVMYKCDLCHSKVAQGGSPACVEACPKQAITFGPKEQMRKLAHERVAEIGGYLYGEAENGGTSTFYASPVPFEAIHQALAEQRKASPNPEAPGFPLMPVGVENYLQTSNGLASTLLLAPVAGVLAASAAAWRGMSAQKRPSEKPAAKAPKQEERHDG
jgi:formate dehydrogenase iron-sulfur subunit